MNTYFTKNKTLSFLANQWNQTKDYKEKEQMKQRINYISGRQDPKFDVMHIINDIFIYKFDVDTLLYNYYIIEESIYKDFIDANYCNFKNEMQIRDYDKFYDIQFVWLSLEKLIKLRDGYKNKPNNMTDTDYIMNNIQEWNGYTYKKLFNIINKKQEPIINEFEKNYKFIRG